MKLIKLKKKMSKVLISERISVPFGEGKLKSFLRGYTRVPNQEVCLIEPRKMPHVWLYLPDGWQKIQTDYVAIPEEMSWCYFFLSSVLRLNRSEYQKAKKELFGSHTGINGIYQKGSEYALVYKPSRGLSQQDWMVIEAGGLLAAGGLLVLGELGARKWRGRTKPVLPAPSSKLLSGPESGLEGLDFEVKPGPEPESGPKPEPKPEESEPEPEESEPESGPEPEPEESEPESDLEAKLEPKPELKTEPEPVLEVKPELELELKAEPDVSLEPGPILETDQAKNSGLQDSLLMYYGKLASLREASKQRKLIIPENLIEEYEQAIQEWLTG